MTNFVKQNCSLEFTVQIEDDYKNGSQVFITRASLKYATTIKIVVTNTDNVIQETCDLRTELRATDTRATIILSNLHANLYPHRETR